MCTLDFDSWLANHLGESHEEVERLLSDKATFQFLIAWSLLETNLFSGSATGRNLSGRCRSLVCEEGFDTAPLRPIIEYFHSRYQDQELLGELMGDYSGPNIKPLLKKPLDELSDVKRVLLIVVVVYRYRNNIFHGSKRAESWLKFGDQIKYCVQIMQSLITHATEKEKSV